jgi:hypothetical protein
MCISISRVRALFAISGVLCFALSAQAAGRLPVEVMKENRIDARIENLRLDKVLRLMSEKKLFEIMGSVSSEEEVTLYFSGLTLAEAMGKLLRRYNYVLMNRPSKEPLLILIGKIERPIYAEKATSEQPSTAAYQQPGAETEATLRAQLPRGRRHGGDAAASTPQETAQTQAQQPETAKQPAREGQQGTAASKTQETSEASKESSPPQQAGQAPKTVATESNDGNTLIWTAEGRF